MEQPAAALPSTVPQEAVTTQPEQPAEAPGKLAEQPAEAPWQLVEQPAAALPSTVPAALPSTVPSLSTEATEPAETTEPGYPCPFPQTNHTKH